ncbi:MAG: winged helix-turn-helix domain-containing protein [Acidobacteriota bacterium]
MSDNLDPKTSERLLGGFLLGPWRIEPQRLRVSCGAESTNRQPTRLESTSLEPKVMRVLLRLAASPGKVVSREELRQVGWDDSFAAEEGLRRAVMLLRRVFRDDARTPAFIETIPRVGYRLIGEVRPTSEPEPVATKPVAVRRWAPPARRWLAASLVVGLGAVALVASGRFRPESPSPPQPGMAELTPVTSYPGRERDVSLSPDGEWIAFAWNAGDDDASDIFVRRLDDETPRRVTTHADPEIYPAWSPDGRRLAYARQGTEATRLMVTQALEPSPSAAAESDAIGQHAVGRGAIGRGAVGRGAIEAPELELASLAPERIHGLSWSPDGRWLAFAQRPAPGEPVALFRLEVVSRYLERLTAPPAGVLGDLEPAWSPDGGELVFARRGVFGMSDLFALQIAEGTLHQLTHLRQALTRPAWSPDGHSILFVRRREDRYGLSWVPRAGGPVRDLELSSDHIVRAAVAPSVDRVVVERMRRDIDLWRLDLDGPLEPERWLSSTAIELYPAFSADSRRVAFISDRSGSGELWVAERGAAHPERLTSISSGLMGRPQWSPDGDWIAFDSSAERQVDVYVIPAEGGTARRLTTDPAEDCLPAWSRDGSRLYFASNRSGRWQIWRRGLADGDAEPVTRHGGFSAAESFDGHWLYYVKPTGIDGLWRQAVEGGEEQLVLADFDPTVDWALTPEGVFHVEDRPAGSGAVIYHELPQGEERTVWQLAHSSHDLGMAVSGDGRYLALALLHSNESDLLMTQW